MSPATGPVAGRRLLLVHAHPDDESITTGATISHYAALGVQVTVVTCTLGEEGEILVPEYAGLEAGQADQLGGYRIGELAGAMRALGVTDHRFLGGAGRFRDSGMMGVGANAHPRAFWRAADDPDLFDAAVGHAVQVVRDVRPQVVVTYDARGDYGHPDHIMAHRVTTAAVAAAADPRYRTDTGKAWTVSKLYWTATTTADLRRGAEALCRAPDVPFTVPDVDRLPFGVADDDVTTTIDARAGLDAKRAALRAHATQVAVVGDFFALTNLVGRELTGVEHYRLAHGAAGAAGNDGVETDLFAGVGP